MPQIWLTVQELATLFACTEAEARKLANIRRLERSKGRDGLRRVKLCSIGEAIFAQKLRAPNEALDRAIERQDIIYNEMKASFSKWSAYYPWVD